jgi:Nucleoside-diphosphate-sugar epimerases
MDVKQSFWKGKRVLITGNTGFKGAWLSLWLHKLGADVHGLSLSVPTEPSLFNVCGIPELAPTTFADIRDLARLTEDFKRVKPESSFTWRRSRWCESPTWIRWRLIPPT